MSRTVVAQGSFTQVERCDCGSVYLTVGPVCLKLHPDALPELRETLGRAVRALARPVDDNLSVLKLVGSRKGEAVARDGGESGWLEGDDAPLPAGTDPAGDPN